jgi:transposase
MMGSEQLAVAPGTAEVQVIEHDLVRRIELLVEAGFGSKRIARELGIARNTVRRYARGKEAARVQTRPRARGLTPEQVERAIALFDGEAESNAVVVHALLGVADTSVRCVQRAVQRHRARLAAKAVASVRFETRPGEQMQIDFGQKQVRIAGALLRVHLLVAVLGFSRRIFVKAFLAERQHEWLTGIIQACQHFGGVAHTLLCDNPRALVVHHDPVARTVRFHRAFTALCKDLDCEPRACRPYRARTKGKTESGVKYVKRNALAGRAFASFAELESHLAAWCAQADLREHGTTHESPASRFARAERDALKPLPADAVLRTEQSFTRRVAHDAYVDIDTVRYSVPHQLVREHVEVRVTPEHVRVYSGAELVAEHVRSREPHQRVTRPEHHAALWRTASTPSLIPRLAAYGRSLADYAQVVGGVQ